MKKYILCCVSPDKISENFIKRLQTMLDDSGVIIERSEVLSERGLKAIDLHLLLNDDLEKVKAQLLSLSNETQVDMAIFEAGSRENMKLIVFDMDSTLIEQEVIDEMAYAHGVGEQVKLITEKAMKGELDFNQALRERVALLHGFNQDKMQFIRNQLTLSPGVEKLIQELKHRGFKTAIISGGFKYFAEYFKDKLGLDYAFANELEFIQNNLSGKIAGKIINAQEKALILEQLSLKENIHLSQTIALGDGANDLLMLAKAGLGVAYHAKEKVRQSAKHHLNFGPMTVLLYFLGFTGDHLDETL